MKLEIKSFRKTDKKEFYEDADCNIYKTASYITGRGNFYYCKVYTSKIPEH